MENSFNADVKVDFFKESPTVLKDIFNSEFRQTLDDIMDFMAYLGIEKLTLKGKTPEDDKRFREHLKNRKLNI